MIAAWILYSLVLGGLLAGVAHLAEGLFLRVGLPTRRIWLASAAGSVMAPVLAFIVRDAPPAFEVDGFVISTSATSGLVMDSVASLSVLDDVIGWLWLVASVAVCLHFFGGAFVAYRRRRGWRREVIDDVGVLVSDDVGPAVIGFLRSEIVMPEWALAAPATERSIMVRHEKEHVDAGDPHLVALTALLLVIMPWNAAIWYATRRMRLAIEVDCDRRVMRSGEVNIRRYAELLLVVGSRRAPRFGVAFSVGRPFLEQRIDRMTHGQRGSSRRGVALALAGIAAAVALAFSVPQPVRAYDASGELMQCPAPTVGLNKDLLDWAQRST